MAVGLRPQADASRYRLRERVPRIKLVIQIALNLGHADANFRVVPLMRRGRCVSNPANRRTLVVLELLEHEVVFQAVGADRRVIPVRLEIEQDADALIDAARRGRRGDVPA